LLSQCQPDAVWRIITDESVRKFPGTLWHQRAGFGIADNATLLQRALQPSLASNVRSAGVQNKILFTIHSLPKYKFQAIESLLHSSQACASIQTNYVLIDAVLGDGYGRGERF
jgi:hypothetical protein